jgi:hypothetical protein
VIVERSSTKTPVDHLKVGDTALATVISMAPSAPPQLASDNTAVRVGLLFTCRRMLSLPIQPKASVVVTLYSPPLRLDGTLYKNGFLTFEVKLLGPVQE